MDGVTEPVNTPQASAALKNNPSFIGQDGTQIDVTYYPRKNWNGKVIETVEVRKDETFSYLHFDPRDVPTLIAALQQVHEQRQAFLSVPPK